jgi:hypothetical protein
MTKDDFIRMAREYDLGRVCGPLDTLLDYEWEILQRFANLVAAAEREKCAKVCEDGINNATDWDSSAWDQACENRATAIRARRNT